MKYTFIFGAGLIGTSVFFHLEGKQVAGFIDNDKTKIGGTHCGVKIYSLDETLQLIESDFYEKYEIIVACEDIYAVYSQLREAGLDNCIGYDELQLGRRNIAQTVDPDMLLSEQKSIQYILSSDEKCLTEDIKTIVLAGYNIDDLNIGCRATSEALRKLLSTAVKINETIYRYELLNMFTNIFTCECIEEYIAKAIIEYPEEISELKEKISSSDAVVINGEGSFIFTSKPRKDLYNFCVLMYLCVLLKKPFFVVNAMMSAGNDGILNAGQYKQVSGLLMHAKKICLRDPVSVKIIEKEVSNVCYVPDALFGEYTYYEFARQNSIFKINNLVKKYGKERVNEYYKKQDIKYVVFSGNSEAAYHQIKAIESFRTLIQYLLKFTEERGIQLVLVECCSGDKILRELSSEYHLPFIPVETSVNVIGLILQNALCFISGRYHPSILASMGGTPCVFMGSNSHKTQSLQKVLEKEEAVEFAALPDENECKAIVAEAEKAIANINREELKELSKENYNKTKNLTKVLFER